MIEPIAVRLLGPIEVCGPLGAAILTGERQRSLMALLALQTGQAVGPDRLIDGLWGDDAPRTALRTLQSHLARLRQALSKAGLTDAIASGPAGHTLRLPRESVDVHVFEALVRRARSSLSDGSTAEAVTLLGEALALWRGEPLQDGQAFGHALVDIDRLLEARSSALEDLWDGRLRLGDHVEAIGELQVLLAAQPYRERAAGLLMLALYRASRPAEALSVYQRLREELAEGLGVDPGAELQQLHTAILRQDPSLDPRPESVSLKGPSELPPRVGYFTGRADEFAGLDKLLAARETDADEKIVLIYGAAGIGKTALAVEWAHHAAARFPDGQFFLDLQGHDPQTTVASSGVLGHLLRGFGVPPERIPSSDGERIGLYRSLVRDRRYLILLDNARTIDQVVPVIPATRSSLLMVTSRLELSALAVRQPVHFVPLPAFDGATGLELLRRAVDAERIEGEREASRELVAFCGGMPLAMRITAARLASRPTLAVTELMRDLRMRELDALAVPGDSAGIRAVFASAYTALSAGTQRTFRLLATHPGPSFSAHLAGHLDPEAEAHLAELTEASLLIRVGERYRFHDLIRLYAAELATPEETEQALSSIFDWYLRLAHAANRILDPARDRVTVPGQFTAPFGQSHQDVVAFLDGEQPSLGPVVAKASAVGRLETAWQLTYLVAGFYDSRGSHDRIDMCDTAIDAAQRLGDASAEVLMRNMHAATSVLMRRFGDALAQLELALPLALNTSDTWLLATTYTNMAVANTWLDNHDSAQESLERALAIHTANENRHAVALSLNNLAEVQRRAGRPADALARLSAALELVSSLDNPRMEAILRHSMGQTHHALGSPAAALAQFEQALALRRRTGDRRGEANALLEIGALHLSADRLDDAVAVLRAALGLSRLLGNEHLEAMLLNRIGDALLRTGDVLAAAASLRQSLTLRERIPDPHEEDLLRRNLARLPSGPGA
ncbi:AfsR/SARP family transcriptional regulator [Allorhizocola rhizosphaerae]|uniref:AfsR/SARP family transcriptional regulator n=1 Tax=Allorhizocola rhizosphaerae TaxID=1872709 RepID=UPI000E3C6BDE|nr:AfsR/SARP family transcriptional regulator [Allorhizocola rhizosphaerae]